MGDGHDGRDTRWEPHRAARRALILDAAIELLEEGDGADPHVQDIARRAGLGRAVVYRHFADRAAIERAVRGRVLKRVLDELTPAVRADGTIHEIITRIVRTYVAWASEHPVLHRILGESNRETAGLDEAVMAVGGQISGLIRDIAASLGLDLQPGDEAIIDPVTLGMVGNALTVVRNWLSSGPERQSEEQLVEMLAEGFWFQIDGHARQRGYEVDPDRPLPDADRGEPPVGK